MPAVAAMALRAACSGMQLITNTPSGSRWIYMENQQGAYDAGPFAIMRGIYILAFREELRYPPLTGGQHRIVDYGGCARPI